MESSRIHKIARILNALVLIALVCNIIILYLVPVAVVSLELSDGYGLLSGVAAYLGDFFRSGQQDVLTSGAAASFLAWLWCWKSPKAGMLTLFLVVSGICTAIILWQGRRVLRTILHGKRHFPAPGGGLLLSDRRGGFGPGGLEHLLLPLLVPPGHL